MSVLASLSGEQIPKNVLCTDCIHAVWSVPGETIEAVQLRAFCSQLNSFVFSSESPSELYQCSKFETENV